MQSTFVLIINQSILMLFPLENSFCLIIHGYIYDFPSSKGMAFRTEASFLYLVLLTSGVTCTTKPPRVFPAASSPPPTIPEPAEALNGELHLKLYQEWGRNGNGF